MNIKTEFNDVIFLSTLKPEELKMYMADHVGKLAQEYLYDELKDLAYSYPDFEQWYKEKVLTRLEEKAKDREIIIILSKPTEKAIPLLTGIAILKKTKEEKKICTFRILKEYRNNGIGTLLFKKCFEHLGTDKPLISISEDRLEMFKYHIEKYEFEKIEELPDYYTKGSTEYVFNGRLTK